MPADALAPQVTRSSPAIPLTVNIKHIFISFVGEFQQSVVARYLKIISWYR